MGWEDVCGREERERETSARPLFFYVLAACVRRCSTFSFSRTQTENAGMSYPPPPGACIALGSFQGVLVPRSTPRLVEGPGTRRGRAHVSLLAHAAQLPVRSLSTSSALPPSHTPQPGYPGGGSDPSKGWGQQPPPPQYAFGGPPGPPQQQQQYGVPPAGYGAAYQPAVGYPAAPPGASAAGGPPPAGPYYPPQPPPAALYQQGPPQQQQQSSGMGGGCLQACLACTCLCVLCEMCTGGPDLF
jgi:hypothetical protein